MQRNLFCNKRLVISLFIIVVTTILLIIYFLLGPKIDSNQSDKLEEITASLIGEEEITLQLGIAYIDEGIVFQINGVDSLKYIEIENEVDVNIPGEYYVNYSYNGEILLTRKIIVLDNIAPTIKLNGNKEITMIQGGKYEEQGYTATDNMDGNITNKVEINGKVNPALPGSYTITYSVSDSSNNKTSVKRKITVIKKPAVVIKQVSTTEKGEDNKIIPKNGDITSLVWSSKGITIEGCVSDSIKSLKLNDIEFTVNVTDKCYKSNLDLSNLENGEYIFYYDNGEKSNKIDNQLNLNQKIVRCKIGNKLYTFIYDNNDMKLKVEDFTYQYDILIDVGHGGKDPGAINFHMNESDLNLEISKYEKKRYEEHGLTVLMTRTDDTYGILMGSSEWKPVQQRAHAVGYYSVVSKISYSNHHNSFPTSKRMGYEIIVTASFSQNELKDEKRIISLWKNFYPLTESHVRLYSRNYDTDSIKTKENGEVYSFRNYYAMNRIPYELYNSKVSIYEGCYMSNLDDFTWYYLNNNWILVSEAKIKVYVESLGLNYIEPE